MRSHIVLYFGKPGAGKGTRTQKLKERTFLLDDFMILSTGQMLRQAVADGTHLGQEAKAYMDKGELVPDHLIVSVVLDAIEKATGKTISGRDSEDVVNAFGGKLS